MCLSKPVSKPASLTGDFNQSPEGVSRYERTCAAQNGAVPRALSASCPQAENLHTQTDMTVERIEFEAKKATGVTFSRKGKSVTVKANQEVILSAGALNSPQIMLRSGVGPADEIKPHGLEVVHELAGVGHNLQDHYGVVSQFAYTQPVTLHRSAPGGERNLPVCNIFCWARAMRLFRRQRRAHFSNRAMKAVCDMQIHYVSVAVPVVHGRLDIPTSGFSSIVYGCRPESRGHLGLQSASLEDVPAIYPNYLAVEQDVIDTQRFQEDPRYFPAKSRPLSWRADEANQGCQC